jgi:pimeloyl-ACP methyl ester carboxylesterase
MKTGVKVLLGIAIGLVVLLVVAYLGMGYVIYDKLGNVKGSCDEHQANRPDNFALHPTWPASFDVTPYYMSPYETVKFPSRQKGIEVAGWWISAKPVAPAAPAVILVDGLGGCKNSIAVLTPAGMLWRNGFNVLLIDLRDTGDSTFQDGRSTIGNEEYQDVLGAWDWLVNVKGFAPGKIGLFANSLGGANANYAFSEEPRIAALFLQSTFGNLRQVLAAELTRAGYPTFLAPGALVTGSIVTGVNLFGHDPLSAVRKDAGRPVYIVHTRADTRININQSEQLAAAAQAAGVNVTTWFPENGEHVQTPAAYPQEFERRLVGFFRQSLGQ